ncbi:MAG TPA: glycosyltransferase [Gemmatimonadales bacterium]|jgi:glycosyltransferase involved in cell wall biosynthesis|nr:glycosyltransferase [Gemmatimonadales bacterium]
MHRVLIASHVYVEPTSRGKLRALAGRGLELTVAVPQRWRDPTLDRTRETSWERTQALEIFPIPVTHSGVPGETRFGTRALAALVRDKRPELVQIEAEPESALARQLVRVAARLRVPTVIVTEANVDGARTWMEQWRRRRVLRRLAGALAASDSAARLVRRDAPNLPVGIVPPQGAQVPPTPVHTPHEHVVIGFVGRLVPHRGLDTLLQALAQHRDAPWRLIVAGDGPERERLERLASELRLPARVRWVGALPPERIAELWPDLDLLVVPSRPTATWNEPTGVTLLEAMAHEVSVIGSRAGVLPELIGTAGLVTPPNDADALSAAIGQMLDLDVRAPLARAARARALELYSDDAVAEQTMAFWQRVSRKSAT